MYVFYHGAGGNSLYYTTFDSSNWISPRKVLEHGIGIADNTSPCAVSFHGSLYLFWCGSGNDGIFCTIFNGSSWGSIFSIASMEGGQGFLPNTSPAAEVFNSKLYLFWNGKGDDGIWYTTFDGHTWTNQLSVKDKVPSMSISKDTSPAAVAFQGGLYLFWNGAGKDSTLFTRFSNEAWDSVSSLAVDVGGQGYLASTSPSALSLGDQAGIRVFWTGSGANGAWHASFNGSRWTHQVSMSQETGDQSLMANTNVNAAFFEGTQYVFWTGSDSKQTIWFSTSK